MIQRGHGLVLAVSALSLTMGGCIVERSYETESFERQTRPGVDRVDTDSDVELADPGQTFTRSASEGLLQGDIGPALGIDDDRPLLVVYDDGWFATIETVTVRPDRAAMLMLSMSNPDEVLVAGERTWRLSDQLGETQVTVLGCTGPEVGIYDEYDAPADEVDVIVEETPEPGEVVVQVHARWTEFSPGDARAASASFRLLRE